MKVQAPWREGSIVIPLLFLGAVALGIAVLFHDGVINAKVLADNKDAIDAGSTVISTTLLVAGAAAAYVKFFKGRLLRPKLNLKLNGGVIPGRLENTVWVEAEISNAGVVVIYDYTLGLDAVIDGVTEDFSPRVQNDVTGATSPVVRSIYVGETAFAHAVITLPSPMVPTTFRFFVKLHDKTRWSRRITLSAAAPPAP